MLRFNPRARAWARQFTTVVRYLQEQFQSTRPCVGATDSLGNIMLALNVSIHAPVRGRDAEDR